MTHEATAPPVALLRAAADHAAAASGELVAHRCLSVAAAVHAALTAAGVLAKLAAGGLVYRAGPSRYLDLVAFCGRNGRADLDLVVEIQQKILEACRPGRCSRHCDVPD